MPPNDKDLGLLRWPAFLLSVGVVLWANTLAALTGWIELWKLRGKRNDTVAACQFVTSFFRVNLVKIGDGSLHRGPCMYLANHRSWADFFLDLRLVEGRAAVLSRLMVLFVFPTTLLSSVALRAIILFKRGRVRDKEAFNCWLDARRAKSPYPCLLVYPEGHRSTLTQSLPLKRGMLRYAFDRKLPVQLVISGNKDAVLAEKRGVARFNQTVGVTYSELIQPSSFSSFDDFMRHTQATWDRQWALANTADLSGLPQLPAPEVDMDYPLAIRLRQAAVVLFWAAVFLMLAVPWALRCIGALLAALGPSGPWVAAVLAAYTAASLRACSRPVDVRRGPLPAGPAAADFAPLEHQAPPLAETPPDVAAGRSAAEQKNDNQGAGRAEE